MTREQLERGREIDAELKHISEHISDIVYLLDKGVTSKSIGVEAIGTSCFSRIEANQETIKTFLETVKQEHITRKTKLQEEFEKL